jgi:uncharacterized protein YqjF (DUF2071 family)
LQAGALTFGIVRIRDILACTDHRPWPLPSGPWILTQTWHDLLFAHWPVQAAELRALVPRELALDTFNGQCWVAVAPFHMSDIRVHGMPAIPGLSRTPELNVRTYVTVEGKPGVYFFSLDAASRAAVWAARKFFYLLYFLAHMEVREESGSIVCRSKRTGARAEFRGRYRPIAPVNVRKPGTIEHWLTERYCLYTIRKGVIYRSEIHHQPWPLQDAAAEITTETMAQAAGIKLPTSSPLLHFSKYLKVLIWPLRRVR